MKITFIGLSCFLIENEKGFRILVDPFNPSPEWILGPTFPQEFDSKPFGANIVLMTEPDSDHAYAPGGWLQNAPATKPGSNPFPDLDLRGTVVYEWNGDLNVAYHYTVDGIRLAHFGDNAHLFTDDQLKEIGHPDVVFMAAPKAEGEKLPNSLQTVRKNIALLKPKIVIWAHHLAPKGMPEGNDSAALRKFFQSYFKKNASMSKMYDGDGSFLELCYCLENAMELSKDFLFEELHGHSLKIDKEYVDRGLQRPVAILFRSMLAQP